MATRLGGRFDKLSIAAGVSNIGDGVTGAALPLLVASLTRDPLLVAGATLVGRLPWLLFALLSGALVDRMDRKRVMVVTNILRAVGIGLLAWGIATDRVELLAVKESRAKTPGRQEEEKEKGDEKLTAVVDTPF